MTGVCISSNVYDLTQTLTNLTVDRERAQKEGLWMDFLDDDPALAFGDDDLGNDNFNAWLNTQPLGSQMNDAMPMPAYSPSSQSMPTENPSQGPNASQHSGSISSHNAEPMFPQMPQQRPVRRANQPPMNNVGMNNMGMNSGMNSGINQGRNGSVGMGMNNMNAGINPSMSPNMSPNMSSMGSYMNSMGPNMGSNMNPNVISNMNPNMSPNMSPNMNHKMNPNMSLNMNPNMNPNMHPNMSPRGVNMGPQMSPNMANQQSFMQSPMGTPSNARQVRPPVRAPSAMSNRPLSRGSGGANGFPTGPGGPGGPGGMPMHQSPMMQSPGIPSQGMMGMPPGAKPPAKRGRKSVASQAAGDAAAAAEAAVAATGRPSMDKGPSSMQQIQQQMHSSRAGSIPAGSPVNSAHGPGNVSSAATSVLSNPTTAPSSTTSSGPNSATTPLLVPTGLPNSVQLHPPAPRNAPNQQIAQQLSAPDLKIALAGLSLYTQSQRFSQANPKFPDVLKRIDMFQEADRRRIITKFESSRTPDTFAATNLPLARLLTPVFLRVLSEVYSHLNRPPVGEYIMFLGRKIAVISLFQAVQQTGGFLDTSLRARWFQVTQMLGFGQTRNEELILNIIGFYAEQLLPFEIYICRNEHVKRSLTTKLLPISQANTAFLRNLQLYPEQSQNTQGVSNPQAIQHDGMPGPMVSAPIGSPPVEQPAAQRHPMNSQLRGRMSPQVNSPMNAQIDVQINASASGTPRMPQRQSPQVLAHQGYPPHQSSQVSQQRLPLKQPPNDPASLQGSQLPPSQASPHIPQRMPPQTTPQVTTRVPSQVPTQVAPEVSSQLPPQPSQTVPGAPPMQGGHLAGTPSSSAPGPIRMFPGRDQPNGISGVSTKPELFSQAQSPNMPQGIIPGVIGPGMIPPGVSPQLAHALPPGVAGSPITRTATNAAVHGGGDVGAPGGVPPQPGALPTERVLGTKHPLEGPEAPDPKRRVRDQPSTSIPFWTMVQDGQYMLQRCHKNTHGGRNVRYLCHLGNEIENWRPEVAFPLDLGTVDLHAVTLSLASRDSAEVRQALDKLAVVSANPCVHESLQHSPRLLANLCNLIMGMLSQLIEGGNRTKRAQAESENPTTSPSSGEQGENKKSEMPQDASQQKEKSRKPRSAYSDGSEFVLKSVESRPFQLDNSEVSMTAKHTPSMEPMCKVLERERKDEQQDIHILLDDEGNEIKREIKPSKQSKQPTNNIKSGPSVNDSWSRHVLDYEPSDKPFYYPCYGTRYERVESEICTMHPINDEKYDSLFVGLCDRLLLATCVVRNLSFSMANRVIIARKPEFQKLLWFLLDIIGEHPNLLDSELRTLDLCKDLLTVLGNIALYLRMPNARDALKLILFLISFAPVESPYTKEGNIKLMDYDIDVHRYLPNAVDVFVKIAPREEPNRKLIEEVLLGTCKDPEYHKLFNRWLAAQGRTKAHPAELLTRMFALSVVMMPLTHFRPPSRDIETRQPYLLQGSLALEQLVNMIPDGDSNDNIAYSWLNSLENFGARLVRTLNFMGMVVVTNSNGEAQRPFANITQRGVNVVQQLYKKAKSDPRFANNGIVPSIETLLGGLMAARMDKSVVKHMCSLYDDANSI